MELLLEIFKYTHFGSRGHVYPVALTQVCHRWRTAVLGAPEIWANIRITRGYSTEGIKAIIHTCLERSKTCPLALTWFWRWRTDDVKIIQVVIDHLIIPSAERMQRMTVLIDDCGQINIGAFFTAIESLNFPILRDVEIFCWGSSLLTYKLGRSAPLLRRCRFYSPYLLPPLPSHLVILDYSFTQQTTINIDSLLEFLPRVTHSLEHLRFRPPVPNIQFTPGRPKINLQNLKSLLVEKSHIIMDHILVPNLIYFAGLCLLYEDGEVEKMFDDFSAPKLQSIRFYETPLLRLLARHEVPTMFPQLESVALLRCIDESAFIRLLEPPEPEEPLSLGKALENPFPTLKSLAISDTENRIPLQAMIKKRLENGDKSLRKILLPHGWDVVPDADYVGVARWLPKQGIEHVEYEPTWALQTILPAPPEFQDDFWEGEMRSERLPEIFFSSDY